MDQKYEKAIRDTETLLISKGYRRPFTLLMRGNNVPVFNGPLKNCLERIIAMHDESQQSREFRLKTMAPYNDRIHCLFTLSYGEKDRFNISRMEIENEELHNKLDYRIAGGRDIPGSQTLEGLFPKPKPWERFKGRRPGR